jgi:DNA-binding transcriptional MerR regulator
LALDSAPGAGFIMKAMDTHPLELMSLGHFAEATLLSRKALRLYDNTGLLRPAWVDPDSAYRYYRRDQIGRARLIRLMREMEMPLVTIEQVLAAEPPEAEALIESHLRQFADRLAGICRAGRLLIDRLREEGRMAFSVEERQLEPQRVVSITGRVHVGQLPAHIGRTIDRLARFVEEEEGRMTGPPLGIYHGPINQEDDGPIEVCLPAAGAMEPHGDIVIRELPGGPAAVVTVRGDEGRFPTILDAYDAACDWIQGEGHRTLGQPWEVWLSEPDEVAHFEIVWRFE